MSYANIITNTIHMTIPIRSPWLHQLKRVRPVLSLEADVQADIVVVGGGIAGVATAYFLLTQTDRSVLLIEKSKIAHGATGHNAGQLVDGFERSFADIVEEFGLEMAAEGVREAEHGWTLFDELVQSTRLSTPHSQFQGYSAFKTQDHVYAKFEAEALREQGGLQPRKIFVSEEHVEALALRPEWRHLYEIVPHKAVLTMLESKNEEYIMAAVRRKGCMNSALLTEELVGYMMATYPSRFSVVEHTDVTSVTLESTHVMLAAGGHTITANKVVLATNGFEKFSIRNEAGKDINVAFHRMVDGLIGYMAGYLEPIGKAPIAIAYHDDYKKASSVRGEDPYFYLTRRPFELEENEIHNLVCVGGPEEGLSDSSSYVRNQEYPARAERMISEFLATTYAHAPEDAVEYAFTWHGLMGYTPNGIRLVGEESRNKNLLYNLGCNGVGLLPSIVGGFRIARIIRGDTLPASIYDPKNQDE